MFRDNRAADFDYGELLRRDGREVREVLLNLSLRADVTQQLNDRGAC